jgi:chromate transporter
MAAVPPSAAEPVLLAPPPRGRGRHTRRVRGIIFLKDVAALAFTAFGGPQAHLAMMFRLLVDKRRYLTGAELVELTALCSMLPGPTSTQTITAIGFRLGGPTLAYLTLLVWIIPACLLMAAAALSLSYLDHATMQQLVRFVGPVAVGFVAYSAYKISEKVIHTKTSVGLMVVGAVVAYFFQKPWVLPLLLAGGGLVTTLRWRRLQQVRHKTPLRIEWANLILWLGVLLGAAIVGQFTRALPVRLFENFYRNGSLVFGGGQVLGPLLYAEFVEFKHYLSSSEFLAGLGLVQAVPGPNFSLAAYIGALSMRAWGPYGQLLGAAVAAAGIFLPGAFLIFFLIRIWDQLKQYRAVRAALEGINAVSAGLVCAAAILLWHPIPGSPLNASLVAGTFLALLSDRVPGWMLIIAALVSGALIR